jgi:two-component system, NarL family, invasion response regulator UvrY
MNGLDETRILRELMPHVPVIVCSIQIDAQIEREALAAGASAFLSKSDAALTLIPAARDLLEGIAA